MSVTLTITPVTPDTWHDVTRMIERLSPLDPLLLGAEHLPGVVGHQDVHRGGETPPFSVTLKQENVCTKEKMIFVRELIILYPPCRHFPPCPCLETEPLFPSQTSDNAGSSV